ncbi:arginine--tRNA ligase [Fodinicurvata sp. EGI_FJ10296]|uniref:arginine--tRNA ligase n=1 Tax=Fodinicurvata sp. EGI_FJ10296 TaxID=3231908 RepID=UPI0034550CBE
MPSLTADLTLLVANAFEAAGLPPELGVVAVSNRPDLGQFQCNGALPAAKTARRKPRDIADDIVARLKDAPALSDLSVAGPGFINISVSDAEIARRVAALDDDPRSGVTPAAGETVVLDFGGPNVAKPMHVGHLRSSIIGDSLQRLFRFLGYRTVSDVHMGDWGLQMGMVISEIAIRYPDLPYFAEGAAGPFPTESPIGLDELEQLYPQASAACKADPERLEAARRATALLQSGHPGYTALWRHCMTVSKAAMERDFASLGVQFDLWKGEADVNDRIPGLVDRLKAEGVAIESQGALVIPVAEEDDTTEIPPLILLKSDGAVMYGSTDLATIADRQDAIAPDLALYVVDQRQHLHFEQVFRAARKAGIDGGMGLEHIGFGTMNGPDGKPFKTREGGVMKLQDLIRMTTDKARERMVEVGLDRESPSEEAPVATGGDVDETVARQVGLAALKYADLSNHRKTNYIFDLDRFTRFEGKTGPYLQYAVVRTGALLRKAAETGAAPGPLAPPTAVEREVMLTLLQFPDAIAAAHDGRSPDDICEHLYALAQAFSRFYSACHILSEPDPAVKASRLTVVKITRDQMALGLSLLGIDVPEHM